MMRSLINAIRTLLVYYGADSLNIMTEPALLLEKLVKQRLDKIIFDIPIERKVLLYDRAIERLRERMEELYREVQHNACIECGCDGELEVLESIYNLLLPSTLND